MDWSPLYPAFTIDDRESVVAHQQEDFPAVKQLSKNVEIADIGCGFGGLLFALAPRFPDTLVLGTYDFFYGVNVCE